MYSGIEMIVTIIEDNGWVLNALYIMGGIGFDVYQYVTGRPGPSSWKDWNSIGQSI
jgi:hypothetical protein